MPVMPELSESSTYRKTFRQRGRPKTPKELKGKPVPSNPAIGRHFYDDNGDRLDSNDYFARKEELRTNGTKDSYKLTELQLDRDDEGAAMFNGIGLPANTMEAHRPGKKEVDGGAWITITRDIPVDRNIAPEKYCTYWATPFQGSKNFDGYDQYGRYKVEVLVKRRNMTAGDANLYEFVAIFPHEYVKPNPDELLELIDCGELLLNTYDFNEDSPMNKDLLQQKMELCLEEREIIDAMMLDGLDEVKACQEYFFSRHVDTNNRNIFYRPADWVMQQLINQFG